MSSNCKNLVKRWVGQQPLAFKSGYFISELLTQDIS